MADQTLLLADDKGNHTGEYVKKEDAHRGKGRKHLAISVLLYNDKGEILIQRRKHKIHDDIWDFTGSTHHLHRNDGTDETSEEATYRCLSDEYGINEKIPLEIVGAVDYFAADGKFCENEHDIVVVGKYNGKVKPNMEVAYQSKWIDEGDFLKDVKNNSNNYASWVILASKILAEWHQTRYD